jgi:hypothetical protein
MNKNNITEQLKDIKPLLEIPDSSFYLYWGLIFFASIVLAVTLFFVFKKLLDNKKVNLQKSYLKALKTIDWSQTKNAAYTATYYGRLLATDARRKELFSQLEPMLEAYKYKKEVGKLDQDTQNQFNLYVQVTDESI